MNGKPSEQYAIAKLALSLHKTPEEVRDMTGADADLILAVLEYDALKQEQLDRAAQNS